MSMVSFVPLTKLRPFKDNWRVQVKCLHSWKQNTPFAGDTFEMVLADQWVSLNPIPDDGGLMGSHLQQSFLAKSRKFITKDKDKNNSIEIFT
ncbi:hypothetical protein Bca4012_011066 [Brassica carinata]